MFWLLPAPYVRWLAAALVFAVAAYLDFAGARAEPFPFSSEAIAAGDPVGAAVDWRDVPSGLLPPPADLDGFAARDIAAGEPLVATSVRAEAGVPAGWWSVPIELPVTARRGVAVRLLSPETGLDVPGVVTEPATTGAFATVSTGLVAVAPDAAADVATAAAAGRLVVLVET